MEPRRSKRLVHQSQRNEEADYQLAVENSIRTDQEEKQRRERQDHSHLDEVKVNPAQRAERVYRRKRRRQENDEDPEASDDGNDETPGKSRTMNEIVEKTEAMKDTPSKEVETESEAKKKKSNKKTKRRTPSTKKKKKKDVVRSYFGFSKSEKMDEPSLDGAKEEVLLVEDEDHLQDNEAQVKRTAVKFAYPSREDPEAVEVEEQHLQCLQEQEYVNDTIIDVYIKYILRNQSTALDKFHVFNSFFFKRLAQAVCEEDYHESVGKLRKWTKGIDIYDKQYVLMPVHQQLHWSLVIVCFSGPKPGCHILHLDSMKTGHTSRPIYEVVRRYLAAEWMAHDGAKQDFKNVHEKKVKVPQQQNEYDCGLFMLHFIQQFLSKAPETFSDSMVTDMSEWFSFAEASKLRAVIKEITDRIFFSKDGKQDPALESVGINEDTTENKNNDKGEADPVPMETDEVKGIASSEGVISGLGGENVVHQITSNDQPSDGNSMQAKDEVEAPGDKNSIQRKDRAGDPSDKSSIQPKDRVEDHSNENSIQAKDVVEDPRDENSRQPIDRVEDHSDTQAKDRGEDPSDTQAKDRAKDPSDSDNNSIQVNDQARKLSSDEDPEKCPSSEGNFLEETEDHPVPAKPGSEDVKVDGMESI